MEKTRSARLSRQSLCHCHPAVLCTERTPSLRPAASLDERRLKTWRWVLGISKLVTCANSILKFTDLFSWCQKMRTKKKAKMSLHHFQLKVIVLPQNNTSTNPRLPEHHELSTITQKTRNPGPSLSWRLHGARSQ